MNFSINNVKANLRGLVCAFLGLFQFILLAIPYASVYSSTLRSSWSESLSGYGLLGNKLTDLYEQSFWMEMTGGVVPFIFQLIAFICGIVLLLSAAYLLVKAFFGVEMPEQFGPVSVAKVRDFALMGYAGANALLFVSLIIISLANSEELLGAEMGVGLGFGIFLAVILSVGAFVALKVLEQKMPQLFEAGAPATRYVCEQCGASAKKGAAFCAKCGGKVIEMLPVTYACEQCGAAAKKGVAFCSKCGGKIVANTAAPAAPAAAAVCPQCGAALKEGAAFCTTCGCKIG